MDDPLIESDFNPFHATGLFLYTLKTSVWKEISGMKWIKKRKVKSFQ